MAYELTRAYPLLKKQWPGKYCRLKQVGRKNWPDFLLIHDGEIAFVEVKVTMSYTRKISNLSIGQAKTLNALHEDGLNARLLVLVDPGAIQEGPIWALFVRNFAGPLYPNKAYAMSRIASPCFIFNGLSDGLFHSDDTSRK